MAARIDDPALDVSADSVIVLQNAGPQARRACRNGAAADPAEAAQAGRARHGAYLGCAHERPSYGACVLHVAPEAYVGGPLALVRDGDMVALDVPGRSLNLLVPDAELARARRPGKRPPRFERGYGVLYLNIGQADTGCDFDFLQTEARAEPTGEPEIH